MSDVEKTISGLNDGDINTRKTTTTTTTKTNEHDLRTKTTKLKYQQQQQQHQHKQSINYYSNNVSGSAVLTDSTVAEESPPPSCRNNCISRILKLIFSTPGLVLLVVGYSVMGALIFPLLEAQQDITKSAAIAKSREDCLRELWIITEKLNVLYERNWTMLVHEQLRRFEGSIVAATRNGGAGVVVATASRNGHSTALGHFGANLDTWDQARWSFSEALLYSVTVITTIGHGSLTPKTAAGKIATILYALIGVPLMLMCLSSLGALLAEALQCTYAKLCCGARETESDSNKRRDEPHNVTNHQRTNEMKCHSKGQGLNCKDCKYDAIVDETKMHHPYEYNESNSTSDCVMAHCSNEDSCQLLHNSPKAKLNHNSSPCMQLKMTPQHAVTIAQYYHQQKQQQQLQQQQQPHATYSRMQAQSTQPLPPPLPQPDVMLLGTTAVPTTAATSATTLPRSNATSSPQHLPHQLQPTTTFHIVANSTSPQLSSSTHSSPIHYSNHQHQNNHHQHASPSPVLLPQQLTMRQYGSSSSNSMPQHYVAIPSSMVRFQVAPTNQPSNNATSTNCTPMNVGSFTAGNNALLQNCYQPTASTSVAAVTGAATIYFPIAGAIGATSTMPRTTTSIGAASTQLLCNQPLVKYHTIQLQHKKPTLNDEVATSGSTSATSTSATPPTTTTTTATESTTNESTTYFNVADTLPLPPPPAYQTATVHGVRRAKFIAKPLPPEINNLLAESDVNTTPLRYDLSTVPQNNITTIAAMTSTTSTHPLPTTTATTTTTTSLEPTKTTTIYSNDNVFLLSTGCTTSMSSAATSMPGAHNLTTTLKGGESLVTLPTNATTSLPAAATTNCTFNVSNVTVDIMEDEEEEQEQQRLGNCPHGTPSRMPLIPNCSNGDGKHGSNSANPAASNDRDYDKSTRGLINATAASFHRHTLQTFQRNAGGNGRSAGIGGNAVCRNNRKSALVTHQGGNTIGGNSMHTSAIWMRRASSGCYGSDPNGDTSEDDDYQQQPSNDSFALEQFNSGNYTEDLVDDDADETDDDLGQYHHNGPQVPISIVFLILLCYVSLGTVIFALWENWSLIDGAYFCFVTLATIGYGDFMPERTFHGPEVQLFACCAYLLLGLVLVAMSFSILETQLIWKCKRIAVRLRLAKD